MPWIPILLVLLLYMFRAAFLPIIRSRIHPTPGSKRSSQLHKMYQSRCTAKNSWWWAEWLPETCRVVVPIKLEFRASVGFIHKERIWKTTICEKTIQLAASRLSYNPRVKLCATHFYPPYCHFLCLHPDIFFSTVLDVPSRAVYLVLLWAVRFFLVSHSTNSATIRIANRSSTCCISAMRNHIPRPE